MNHIYASRKYRSGFSLIEILVAVLILSVGLLGIAGLQSQLMGSGIGSRENSIAEALAKQKMEEFKQDGFGSLPAIPSGSTSVTQSDSANPFNSVDLFYSTGNSNNRESNDFSAEFNRSWVVSAGPTANSRLVKVIVSWVNKSGQTKNFSIYSYITLFSLTGFANQTVPAGSSANPVQTITQWKPGGNYYKKDVIVSYKDPNGVTKYYMSNSNHTDNYALTDPGSSSDWALVNFIQGNLTWTPNSTTTHTVCELRFADEITAFGTKPNGSIDPSATNPNATSRRCSPNMLSGQGILSTNFACALKAGESKSVYAQCEIEDGSGGTTIMGPIGPYTTAQTGVNLNLCQSSGTCISSTPAPTSVPTATPVTTATPVPTATPIVTATPVPTATPVATVTPTLAPGATATPKPPATLQITLNMANNNKKDGSTCTLQILTTGTVCAASSWSTIAVSSGSGSGERNYSTTCTITGSSANINLQCGNTSTNSYSSWIPLTLTPGNTTTQIFNNF